MYAPEERLRRRKESRKRWADKNKDKVREIGRRTDEKRRAALSDEDRAVLNNRRMERYRSDPEYRKEVVDRNKKWSENNREKCRAIGKAYREKHREELNAKKRERRKVDVNKHRARRAVETALKNGTLIKPEKCQRCDGKKLLEGHHHKGYDVLHWLDVVWLCTSCHKIVEPPNGKYH